ncbi:MAG: putative membrane protein [Myxococcota bacterium]|jgi:uncharacterized membrane protein
MNELDRGTLERLAAVGAALVGGSFLLLGLVFAFRALWATGWLGPGMMVAGSLAAGALAVALGEVLWGRSLRAVAAGTAGAGLGTTYLTLYVAWDWYGYLSGPVTSALLLAVTGVGAALAVRRDSQLMASLGLLGGLVTPLVLSQGGGSAAAYFAYVALIDAAVVVASVRRQWTVLAGLAVTTTLIVRVGWGIVAFDPAQATTAILSSAVLGGGFALAACFERTPKPLAVLFTLGGLASLVALVPFAALGHAPSLWAAVTATTLLTTLLQAVGAIRRWPLASGSATLLAGAALAGIAINWPLDGAAGELALVALVALPPISAWTSLAIRREAPQGPMAFQVHALWLQAWLVGLTVAALSRDPAWLTAVVVVGAAVSWLAEIRIIEGPAGRLTAELGPFAGVVPAVAISAGAVALLGVYPYSPMLALGAGAVLVGLAMVPPALLGGRADRLRWAPLGIAPVPVVAMVLALPELGVDGMGGLVAIAVGAPALALAVAMDRGLLGGPRDEVGRLAYAGLAVLFATIAVPLQLEQEWLTVGWAVQGALLAVASRRVRMPVVSGAALVLLTAVTVRLVANPAVLEYHFVQHPTVWSWILYGYGVPTVALAVAARHLKTPDSWHHLRIRRALEFAGVAVAFAGVNLEVSHAFSHTGALDVWDAHLPARLVRTLSWTVFGVALLVPERSLHRMLGISLLGVVCVKVLAFDLWVLGGFARAGMLVGVAVLLLGAAGVLGMRSARETT